MLRLHTYGDLNIENSPSQALFEKFKYIIWNWLTLLQVSTERLRTVCLKFSLFSKNIVEAEENWKQLQDISVLSVAWQVFLSLAYQGELGLPSIPLVICTKNDLYKMY